MSRLYDRIIRSRWPDAETLILIGILAVAFSLAYAVFDMSKTAMEMRRENNKQLEVELEIAPVMELEEIKDE